MPELRSNLPPTSALGIARRAQWRSLGIAAADLTKPKVAIVNTSSELAACYAHLDEIADALKHQLRALGVLPFEIRTVAPSDFVTSAGRAGRYILPSRDLIVNDIEAAVKGAKLDGMICLSSCDKTTPAHLMAAGRLDIPTVVVPCGYQHSGLAEGREADVEEVFLLAAKAAVTGEPTDHLEELADDAILGPGVCAGLATANSMHMVAEAIGMAVPGAAPVRANGERMWDSVARSAAAIVDLIERDIRPREIITDGSIPQRRAHDARRRRLDQHDQASAGDRRRVGTGHRRVGDVPHHGARHSPARIGAPERPMAGGGLRGCRRWRHGAARAPAAPGRRPGHDQRPDDRGERRRSAAGRRHGDPPARQPVRNRSGDRRAAGHPRPRRCRRQASRARPRSAPVHRTGTHLRESRGGHRRHLERTAATRRCRGDPRHRRLRRAGHGTDERVHLRSAREGSRSERRPRHRRSIQRAGQPGH